MNQLRQFVTARPGLSLLLLALLVRLAALAADPASLQAPLVKDSGFYHGLAVELASGRGFSEEGRPTARVSPLYPLFLAGVYLAFDYSRLAVLLCQVALGALTVLYLFFLGGEVFSRRVAVLAAAAAAVYWPLIAVGTRLLSEPLFIALLVASGYHTVRVFKYKRPGQAACAAALTGLAVLTRPVVLYFSAVVALWLVRDFFRGRDKAAVSAAALYLGVLVLVQVPWVVRNCVVMGHFIPTSTASGAVLYSGNMPRQGKIFGYNLREHELDPEERYILGLPEVEQDKALRRLAVEGLKKKPPAEWVRLFSLKLLFFWMPFDWEVLGHPEGIFNPWFFLVFLFALVWLSRLKWQEDYFYLAAIVVYFTLICLVAYGSPRMRLPIEPFLLVFAAAGWQELEPRWPGRHKYLTGMVILAVLTAGRLCGEQLKEAARVLAGWLGIW
ncbi:MAG: glycosyltransferase family 39 protein [Candidatus Glassbacteria bacterium]|nr:glycosyltransferase family 39 protein [Candidatus Glassbacteria bacterium]